MAPNEIKPGHLSKLLAGAEVIWNILLWADRKVTSGLYWILLDLIKITLAAALAVTAG